jgi:hypothetical protein
MTERDWQTHETSMASAHKAGMLLHNPALCYASPGSRPDIDPVAGRGMRIGKQVVDV